MNSADLQQTARHYDSSASNYDASVDGVPVNAAARAVFCSLVETAAGPTGRILDFGCGTGTDAHWYAQRGHHVIAYDISSGMLDQLVAKCANDITNGRIVVADDRSSGLAPTVRAGGPVDVIAANFAVLNHLDDLHAGLTELSSYLKPEGTLVASFINATNIRDMRTLWWWRAALRDLTAGNITVRGDVATYRYFMREVRRDARPTLRVTQITPGPPPPRTGIARFAPLRLRTGALFVTMRKAAP